MTDLETIQKAVIEAVPEIGGRNTSMRLEDGPFDGLINHRDTTIRLADVLLALEKKVLGGHDAVSYAEATKLLDLIQLWNLRENDLTKQSKECHAFLAPLFR